MENRVGDTLPSEAEIKAEVKAIEGVYGKTEAYGCSLTVDERRTRARFRPGGERVPPGPRAPGRPLARPQGPTYPSAPNGGSACTSW